MARAVGVAGPGIDSLRMLLLEFPRNMLLGITERHLIDHWGRSRTQKDRLGNEHIYMHFNVSKG